MMLLGQTLKLNTGEHVVTSTLGIINSDYESRLIVLLVDKILLLYKF